VEKTILAIVGPTASGKTVLGLKLAREQDGEIISVDSRQVYKYLTVGTAKPRGEWSVERGTSFSSRFTLHASRYLVDSIPYHLVDFLEPSQSFSAADFVKLATETVADVHSRGKTPIFVGGTGLYFKALTDGLAPLPPADLKIRNRLKQEAAEKGRGILHQRLVKVDPEAAKGIPANNIQRVIRALEVYEITGKPISEWHREHRLTQADAALSLRERDGGEAKLKFIGLDPGRAELIRRIEARCCAMVVEGMIEETDALLKQGFSETCPALSGLGYTRAIAYLKKKLSKEEFLKLLIQDTRQYAKRQMTWFRNQLPVTWKK
jgi:tRNA dimethylallyltransferase